MDDYAREDQGPFADLKVSSLLEQAENEAREMVGCLGRADPGTFERLMDYRREIGARLGAGHLQAEPDLTRAARVLCKLAMGVLYGSAPVNSSGITRDGITGTVSRCYIEDGDQIVVIEADDRRHHVLRSDIVIYRSERH